MTLRDRFTRGLISGVLAGIAQNALTLASYYIFHFAHLRWLDWAAIMVYGRRPDNLPETLLAYLLQLAFSGFLGVCFAYLTTVIKSNNYSIKGLSYGLGVWFLLFVIAHLFKVPGLIRQPFGTVATDFVAVLIWGYTVSYVMNYLDNKIKT